MSFNLVQLFNQCAADQPDHPLILGPADTDVVSYGAFREHIRQLAAALDASGISAGMNIGLHYPNGPIYIAYTYAIWSCGACVTPIPVELADQEKQHLLHHIVMDAVISAEHLVNALESVVTAQPQSLPEQACFLIVKSFGEPPPDLSALNPAFIRFTSGTTNDAKGVVLSHETIFERIQAANQGLRISPGDRIVWLLSMAYHFAVSIVAYLSFGATIIIPKNSFGISILEAVNRHNATLIYGAPTHYALMTNDRTSSLPPSLRLAIVTTTRLSSEAADAFYQRFGIALNETYGIIEIGLPAINLEQPREKQGSVGRILPAYQIRLDGQSGSAPGEILLNGPGLLDAYYDPWQSREAILRQHKGWLATGDLGVMDAAGYLTIVGRSKELISVGGMKFFPQEVEVILEQHPAVCEACVFAYPDRRLGEVPHAQLVLHPGIKAPNQEACRQLCAQHLAIYKVPERYQIVSHLRRTASGKVIRRSDSLA